MTFEDHHYLLMLSRMIFICSTEANAMLDSGLETQDHLIEQVARDLRGISETINERVSRQVLRLRIDMQEEKARKQDARHHRVKRIRRRRIGT